MDVQYSTGIVQRFSSKPIPPILTYPKYGLLKHEHDITGKSILEENGWPLLLKNPTVPTLNVGIPSVFRGISVNRVDTFAYFTKEWQFYSFDLIKMNIRRKMPMISELEVIKLGKMVFAAGYRDNAFQSNKHGTKTCHDYVNGNNTDKEDVRLEYQYTGGNVVQILGDAAKVTGAGYCYPVKCFNGSMNPPSANSVNWMTRPDLVMWGTIETRVLQGLSDRQVRYMSFAGVNEFPFFLLAKNSDIIYVPQERVRIISESQMRSNNPYA